jgi:hypothetical protein
MNSELNSGYVFFGVFVYLNIYVCAGEWESVGVFLFFLLILVIFKECFVELN